jgi:glutaredoxin
LQRQSTRALLLIIAIIVALGVAPRLLRAVRARKDLPKPEVERTADIAFFYRRGCPHCVRARRDLRKLEAANPNLKVMTQETSSAEAKLLFDTWQNRYKVPPEQRGEVPALFIESTKKAYVGETDIKKAVTALLAHESKDKGESAKDGGSAERKESTLPPGALAGGLASSRTR